MCKGVGFEPIDLVVGRLIRELEKGASRSPPQFRRKAPKEGMACETVTVRTTITARNRRPRHRSREDRMKLQPSLGRGCAAGPSVRIL